MGSCNCADMRDKISTTQQNQETIPEIISGVNNEEEINEDAEKERKTTKTKYFVPYYPENQYTHPSMVPNNIKDE